jgi:membrane-bound lytic murein transglycosylase D
MRSLNKILIGILVVAIACFAYISLTFSTNDPGKDEHYVKYVTDHYKIFALHIPDTMYFAGERIPLEIQDVKERMDRELMVNTYWQSQTLLLFKRASRWFPIIEPILKAEGVPDDFKYLCVAESGMSNVVSPAGASGYWQFLKETAKQYGLEVSDNVDQRYDVRASTKAACKYLKDSKNEFGTWTLAAAAYNMGGGNVNKQLKRQNVNDYYDLLLNEETSRYVFRLSAMKEILENPSKYGFHFRPNDLYSPYVSNTIKIDSTITNMPAFADSFGMNYKELKILNPWLRDDFLDNPDRKAYYIEIPR